MTFWSPLSLSHDAVEQRLGDIADKSKAEDAADKPQMPEASYVARIGLERNWIDTENGRMTLGPGMMGDGGNPYRTAPDRRLLAFTSFPESQREHARAMMTKDRSNNTLQSGYRKELSILCWQKTIGIVLGQRHFIGSVPRGSTAS